MLTYPGFQSLPQGVKKLLLASETFFFTEAQPQAQPTLVSAAKPQWSAPWAAGQWDRWQPALGQTWRN